MGFLLSHLHKPETTTQNFTSRQATVLPTRHCGILRTRLQNQAWIARALAHMVIDSTVRRSDENLMALLLFLGRKVIVG